MRGTHGYRGDKRNTGIGLAMVCAQKGYPLVVTMAEQFSVERRRLMRFLGAKVVLTPQAGRGMAMVTKAIELARTHGWFLTRQFENEANADMHSRTTAEHAFVCQCAGGHDPGGAGDFSIDTERPTSVVTESVALACLLWRSRQK